ncbi:hypothetical protein PLESTB_001203900 [Pleodorina starrii]|uniref:SET domain-containing protein n=1 Tax=Pleodorina starrii TaxID=330485 RepID=A0A9W6BRQ5_9CHLO|nr:hypothetical protein PLESTM_001746800 [Pleodorina starrii]GLC57251.1 hypothetical protein PLESTB_001203900 [Pleodorina starrii]GLC71359.1 hypothetical protein PLESTF_001107000 [Pleodorina starrii]
MSQPKLQHQNRSNSHLYFRHNYVNPFVRARRALTAQPSVATASTSTSTPSSKTAQAGATAEGDTVLQIASLYTSQAYTHRRAVGPVRLEVVPGKGLGWRATRDIATGELLLVSLPVAVLYGPSGEPPDNEEFAAALAASWPRMAPLERRWLLLLADCCTAAAAGQQAPATATATATVDRWQGPGAPSAAAASMAEAGSASTTPVSLPPSSAQSSAHRTGSEVLQELLLRARALLAEARGGGGGDLQPTAAAEDDDAAAATAAAEPGPGAGAAPPPPLPPPSPSTGGETGDALSAASPSPLSASPPVGLPSAASPSLPSLDILPPAIFGARTGGPPPSTGIQGPTTTTATTTTTTSSSSSSSGGGGVVSELVRRYSYAEAREDPVVSELLDLQQDTTPGPFASSSSSSSPSSASASASSSSSGLSVVGLWPEAALLNHSCAPNAGLLVLGGAAYVRAGRPLMEGEEVTVSYLGTGVFREVAERRSRLRASHGFLCRCPRCSMEHAHFPTRRYPDDTHLDHTHPAGPSHRRQQQQNQQQQQQQQNRQNQQQNRETQSSSGGSSGGDTALDDVLLAEQLMGGGGGGSGSSLLQALLDWVFGRGRFRVGPLAPDTTLLARLNGQLVSELEAAAQAALTAPSAPRRRQAALLERLEGLLVQVDGSCSYLELPPRGRLMVLASVYGIVRLTSDLAELSGQAASPERRLELLQMAAEVMEAVAPGSDGHVTAAVKAAGVARRVHGLDSAPARRAELAAAAAHLARYGRELLTEPALLRRMTATRRRLTTGSGLAASMGVLAWLQHVGGPE